MQKKETGEPLHNGFLDWPDEPACADCRYYRPISEHGPAGRDTGRVCHYLLDTGHCRDCPFGRGCIRREARGQHAP